MNQLTLNKIIKDIRNYIELEKETGLDELMLKGILKHKARPASDIKLPPQDKEKALEELGNKARLCKECALYVSRRNLVFGQGSPDASLVFVGEAPGMEEDIRGEPFVGKAGALLTKIIEAIGLKREEVYIANCLKCRPPQNRNHLPSEIIACREFLLMQIEIIRPKVICCLGKFSAQTLLMSEEPITRLRGKFYDFEGANSVRDIDSKADDEISDGVKLMPTFHPAYLLRNPNEKKLVWEDMKKIRDYIKSKK